MNKRGDSPVLNKIVENMPEIMLFMAALAILAVMLAAFWSKPVTLGEQDYKRIKGEFDAFVKAEYKGPTSFGVPIAAQTNYRIILYPETQAPAICNGIPCLCLHEYSSDKGKYMDTCTPYPKLAGECGDCKKPCVPEASNIEVIKEQKYKIDITRTCGEIRLS
jgi:hypothetical protein